jgi:hypothetical protein
MVSVFSDDFQTLRYGTSVNSPYEITNTMTAALEEAKALGKVLTLMIGFTDPSLFEGIEAQEGTEDEQGPIQNP